MLNKQLISSDRYSIKCPYDMDAIGICIHNTANDASSANEVAYMKRNDNEVSFHIAVDDNEAIQAIPFERNAWAAGDGGNGTGNRKYIHLEICYSKSGGPKFEQAEKRAAVEVAALLKSKGWGIDRVKDHRFFSGKNCPHRTNMSDFKYLVQVELNKLNSTIVVPEKPNSNEHETTRYKETGKCTICVKEGVYFYDKPYISAITGSYEYNESVYYDLVVITNKYVYISWTSASTGKRRYMPVLDKINNERWGNCV